MCDTATHTLRSANKLTEPSGASQKLEKSTIRNAVIRLFYVLSLLFAMTNTSVALAGGSGAVCIYEDSLGNVICSTYGNSGGTCGSGSLGSCNA